MNETRRSNWSARVDLGPADKMQARNAILAERLYYNHVLDGLNGPIRTMPDTLRNLVNRWETLAGIVAANQINLNLLKPDSLSDELAPYADLIFAGGRRVVIDSKTSVIFDLLAGCRAGPHAEIRRALGLELLRYAREQVSALANPLDRPDQVYKFAVQMLVPLDPASKRHVQVPKKLVNVTSGADGMVDVRLPFLNAAISMPEPPNTWSFLILREDLDGRHTVELSPAPYYQLKRTDLSSYRKQGSRA